MNYCDYFIFYEIVSLFVTILSLYVWNLLIFKAIFSLNILIAFMLIKKGVYLGDASGNKHL